ncbi:hypothetical protein Tco_1284309, partial [Tanacetum coccineum]
MLRPRTRVFRPGPVWGCHRLVSKAKVIENQVMAAPVISISSGKSEESMGSHAARVILFGAIPAIIPVIHEVLVFPADPIVTPEVGAVSVVSPSGVLDLVDYSPFSDSDPSEDSLPPAPDLPLVSPFLCSDDLRVAVGVSPCSYESEPATESEDPYRYIVILLHHYQSFTLHLLFLPPPRTSFRRFSGLLLYLCLNPVRAILSIRLTVPILTGPRSSFERSLDSSSPSSRPSRKRCRSPTALVPSSTYVLRSIDPTPIDLLPPRKRFKDSYSPKDSKEEHMEVDTADAEAVADI